MPRVSNRIFKKRPKRFLGKSYTSQHLQETPVPTNKVQDMPRDTPANTVEDTAKKSSSSSKIVPNLDYYDMYKDEKGNNDIVNLKELQKMLSKIARCVKCQGPLAISTGFRFGLSVKIHIQCELCSYEVSFKNSSTLPQSKKTEINARTTYAFRCIGRGEEYAKTFCAIMNLPKPPSFKYYTSLLCQTAKEVCVGIMKDASEECVEENGGDRDITVIFDGSWQRRGHSSLNGIVSAIGANNGKVIDIKVLSKFCRCKGRLQNNHDNNTCVANYSGVSGGMEVDGVLDMFRESRDKYNLRYKYYLGDGDSASYPSVVADQPYGPDFSIEKLECVGHVQKRMGTRLRRLKSKLGKNHLTDGKSIGGRGRLTDAVINEIQIYYGLAIRRNVNTSVEEMKKAVWAEYFHLVSSNEEPAHGLCPPGDTSWCKYKKAVALNQTYDHKEHTHLPVALMEAIKPIFKDLCNTELLRKCLHGGTQNPSESLNNVIWSRIPKTTFVMRETLELGVYEAVSCYNEGNIARCAILKKLGISPGNNCVAAMKMFDELRIKKADKAIDEIEKKCRQSNTLAKRKLEDAFAEAEDPDNPAYGAGMY